MEQAILHLCALQMNLDKTPWRRVLWDPNTKKMINSNKTLAEALFLYMLGQSPRSTGYNLVAKYEELQVEPEARFDLIPVTPLH